MEVVERFQPMMAKSSIAGITEAEIDKVSLGSLLGDLKRMEEQLKA